jgi:hypothetical protein
MSVTEIVVDDPHSAAGTLVRDDLFSVDQALGAEDHARGVREGGIAVRHPAVYDLRSGDFPTLGRRKDAHLWHFLLVHFRFDLEELPGGRHYERARFTVQLGDVRSIAVALHPEHVNTQTDVERSRTFTLGPSLTFEGIGEVSLGEVTFGRRFSYTQLQPVITSSGNGHHVFAWSYRAQKDVGLVAAGRATFAVLQIPRRLEELEFSFDTEVVIKRRVLGIPREIGAQSIGRRARLRVRDGVFTLA